MNGRTTVCLVLMFAVAQMGCAKSDDGGQKAQHALGASRLMPGGMPEAESAYVMDQASVKTLPAREIKYEALETFRAAKTEKGEESNSDAESADAPTEDEAPKKAKSDAGKKGESKSGFLKALGDKLNSVTKHGAKEPKSAKKEKPEKPVEKKAEPVKKSAPAEDKKDTKKAEEKEEPPEGDKDAETAKEESGDGEAAEGQPEGDEASPPEEREGGSEAEGREGGESEEKTEEGSKPDEGGG
ncbi:MAG: hypothetical protein AABZ08_12355 [Planctomycetota bacterium]